MLYVFVLFMQLCLQGTVDYYRLVSWPEMHLYVQSSGRWSGLRSESPCGLRDEAVEAISLAVDQASFSGATSGRHAMA